MERIIKLNDTFNKIYQSAAVALLAGIIVASTLQVFTRYILNASLTGTEEFARYCFVWMNMLGASICVRYGSHAVVSILDSKLHGKKKYIHEAAIQMLIMALSIILFVKGFRMIGYTIAQPSPTLRIPMGFIYASVPVGCMGMIINAVRNICELKIRMDEEG
ncbi:TRAP transporter small permease [Enterocloster bolteae]|uniref:TRAP transporter small permease n=1 Tax=Enterocloster bolteae TaxID=208479 RepID=UPI0026768E19|nr:TRAP transporter small permease [Enterocloster bolteae]